MAWPAAASQLLQNNLSSLHYHPKENCQTSAAFYIIKLEAGAAMDEEKMMLSWRPETDLMKH